MVETQKINSAPENLGDTLKQLHRDDPEIAKLTEKEKVRLETTLNLIAAENHAPQSILEVMGSCFNTKTIEGYPGNRFHGGCKYVDKVENLATERARRLFNAEYVNVQPHSGTSANLAVYFSVLEPGDPILAMSLPHGGHLSHGHKASMTSKCFRFKHYTVDPVTEQIDYDMVRNMALEFRPKMIVAGASSYPRLINYQRMAAIADETSAYLLADAAHIAGLIAGKAIPSPVPYCDFVTFTTYKTMMGGRGGVILARKKYGKALDRSVFPGGQGTSAVSLIAAKAVIFKLAATSEFAQLQKKTIENAVVFGNCLKKRGYRLVTGGTENHQVVVDLTDRNISGSKAETLLETAGIVLNRNVLPQEAGHPGHANGLRIGTGALTARRMGEAEMIRIAGWIDRILKQPDNLDLITQTRDKVREMCRCFPVHAEGA